MTSSLLIVESPSKAKTLKKYLGKGFDVLASYGHVRDLVPKSGAVDPDNGFEMRYEVIDRNSKHVDAIAKAVKGIGYSTAKKIVELRLSLSGERFTNLDQLKRIGRVDWDEVIAADLIYVG